MRFLMITSAALMLVSPAMADDFNRDSPRELVYCFPAKYVVDIDDKLSKMDADRRDVVDIQMKPTFKIYDGGALPDRYFLRTDSMETPFTVQADGTVPDFLDVVRAAKGEGDLCIEDAARVGRPGDDEGLYFEMGLTPYFQTPGPVYNYDLLKEGTKDGKALYKTMIPAVARLFMPDTDYLSVQFDDPIATPRVTALKDGSPIGTIATEPYGEGHVFSRKAVRDKGADSIEIAGGPHRLAPVPSIKTMRRFGIGQKKVYTQNSASSETTAPSSKATP